MFFQPNDKNVMNQIGVIHFYELGLKTNLQETCLCMYICIYILSPLLLYTKDIHNTSQNCWTKSK